MVSSGSIITYQGKLSTPSFSWDTPASIEQQVAGIIQGSGLIVEDSTITDPSFTDILISSTGAALPFGMTLKIQTNSNWGSPDDIRKVVDNAIYQVVGSLPQSSSVPLVQDPNAASGTSTGQVSQSTPSSSGGVQGALAGFLDSVKSDALVLGLAAIGILIGLAVLQGRASRAVI